MNHDEPETGVVVSAGFAAALVIFAMLGIGGGIILLFNGGIPPAVLETQKAPPAQ